MSFERFLAKRKPNYARCLMFGEKKPVPFFIRREADIEKQSLQTWQESMSKLEEEAKEEKHGISLYVGMV